MDGRLPRSKRLQRLGGARREPHGDARQPPGLLRKQLQRTGGAAGASSMPDGRMLGLMRAVMKELLVKYNYCSTSGVRISTRHGRTTCLPGPVTQRRGWCGVDGRLPRSRGLQRLGGARREPHGGARQPPGLLRKQLQRTGGAADAYSMPDDRVLSVMRAVTINLLGKVYYCSTNGVRNIYPSW